MRFGISDAGVGLLLRYADTMLAVKSMKLLPAASVMNRTFRALQTRKGFVETGSYPGKRLYARRPIEYQPNTAARRRTQRYIFGLREGNSSETCRLSRTMIEMGAQFIDRR